MPYAIVKKVLDIWGTEFLLGGSQCVPYCRGDRDFSAISESPSCLPISETFICSIINLSPCCITETQVKKVTY